MELGCRGGWGGIRTHEPLRVGGFQDRCLKPLGHPSTNRVGRPRRARTLAAAPPPHKPAASADCGCRICRSPRKAACGDRRLRCVPAAGCRGIDLIPGARNADSFSISGAWYRARGWWGGRALNQDSYQVSERSTLRRHQPRHAGAGRYPRLAFVAAKKVVDTGLRRHDEGRARRWVNGLVGWYHTSGPAPAERSAIRAAGMTRRPRGEARR